MMQFAERHRPVNQFCGNKRPGAVLNRQVFRMPVCLQSSTQNAFRPRRPSRNNLDRLLNSIGFAQIRTDPGSR